MELINVALLALFVVGATAFLIGAAWMLMQFLLFIVLELVAYIRWPHDRSTRGAWVDEKLGRFD